MSNDSGGRHSSPSGPRKWPFFGHRESEQLPTPSPADGSPTVEYQYDVADIDEEEIPSMKPSDSSGSRPINVNPANWGQHSTSRPSRFLKLYDEIKAQPHGEESLWPIYNHVHQIQHSAPGAASRVLDEYVPSLHEYSASPDLWHNLSIVASRIDNEQAELRFVLHGLAQWPEDVDLLCDALELVHKSGEQTDPAAAEVIWNVLESMNRAITGPFWRFWVFGAQYYIRDRGDPGRAMELLDEGLLLVQRDGLYNILNAYRAVLIDAKPTRVLRSLEEVKAYQGEILRQLEEKYVLGIALGVENAHILAVALAKLYQERAGEGLGDDDSETDGSIREQNLTKALFYLDLAETLFTGSVNHNIAAIYEARARIMMVQHRFGEALRHMRSLPPTRQQEPTVAAMMRLAALSIGENPDSGPENGGSGRGAGSGGDAPGAGASKAEIISEFLNDLFASQGAKLLAIASEHPQIRQIVLAVASQLNASDPEVPA